MKKVYIVAPMLDNGSFDMAEARAFETELDAAVAAELGGLFILTLDGIGKQF
jgi:hypothetical protein